MTVTLDAVAARVIWWKEPSEALADPHHFLARVMAGGTFDEVQVVRAHFPPDAFRAVLDDPPPGVFDARSWAYWNLVCDRQASEIPRRILHTPRDKPVQPRLNAAGA